MVWAGTFVRPCVVAGVVEFSCNGEDFEKAMVGHFSLLSVHRDIPKILSQGHFNQKNTWIFMAGMSSQRSTGVHLFDPTF